MTHILDTLTIVTASAGTLLAFLTVATLIGQL